MLADSERQYEHRFGASANLLVDRIILRMDLHSSGVLSSTLDFGIEPFRETSFFDSLHFACLLLNLLEHQRRDQRFFPPVKHFSEC